MRSPASAAVVFVALLATPLVLRPAPAQDKDKEEVIKLEWKDAKAQAEGSLTKDDPKDKVRKNSYCKVYAVELKGGTTYQIDLASKEIDPFLRVENAEGKRLAEDDDSGPGSNARITFRPDKTGTYRIIAAAFVNMTGAFTLTVMEKK